MNGESKQWEFRPYHPKKNSRGRRTTTRTPASRGFCPPNGCDMNTVANNAQKRQNLKYYKLLTPKRDPPSVHDEDEEDWDMTLNTYSCLATISLSLRDKSDSPIEAPRIKLALVGLKPRTELSSPSD